MVVATWWWWACLSPTLARVVSLVPSEAQGNKWVVEVPLQPLTWVDLAAIYCRHLLTRQRISLAWVGMCGVLLLSPQCPLPCPAVPARAWRGSTCRQGAAVPGDMHKNENLRKKVNVIAWTQPVVRAQLVWLWDAENWEVFEGIGVRSSPVQEGWMRQNHLAKGNSKELLSNCTCSLSVQKAWNSSVLFE